MITENIKAITDFLFIEDELENLKLSDLVIILCNNNIDKIVNKFDELYKNKIISEESVVIISGNHGPLDDFEEKECDLVFEKLVNDYGYNKEMFILEDEATNIYENLYNSKQKIKDLNVYKNILIIGSAFALRRVKLCASGMGYPAEKMQFAGIVDTDKRNCGKDTWWLSEASRVRVYQELERIGKYLVKGDLDIK